MSYLVECLDKYMDELGCSKGCKRRPVVMTDTSFLITGNLYDYDDISWDLIDGSLAYTEGLEEEYRVHNNVYKGGEPEIPDSVLDKVFEAGKPVTEYLDSNISEAEMIARNNECIEQALDNTFENPEEVSKTDLGILSAVVELYPRRVVVLSEDKHLKETVEELKECGYNSYNSGYNNTCAMDNRELEEMLEEMHNW